MRYHNKRFQRSRWCDNCGRTVLAERQGPRNLLHTLLTLVTCFLWLPVWVWVSTVSPTYRCQRCGEVV